MVMLIAKGLRLVMTNSVLIAIDKKSKFSCFHRIYLVFGYCCLGILQLLCA